MRNVLQILIVIFISTELLTAQNWRSIGPAGVPISVCQSSNYILIGTGNSGIIRTTDDGNTWEYAEGIPHGNTPNNIVMCIEHDPQKPQYVYAGTGPDETATGNGFYKSTDGGESWVAKDSGLTWWPAVRQISINPFHPNEIYIYCRYSGGPGIYKSTDYGESWNLFFNEYVNSTLVFNNIDSTKQYLFVKDGTIYQINDSSYSKITTSTNYFSTSEPVRTFTNSKTGSFFYISDSNVYRRSIDSDWVSIIDTSLSDSIKFNNILSSDINQDEGIIYVSTDKGVLISSNDGNNWLVIENLNDMKVSIDSSRTILIGLDGLYSSVDNGIKWSKLSNGLNISSVIKSSIVLKEGKLTIYLIGTDNNFENNFLFKSTNEGASWTTIDLQDKVPVPLVIKANPLNPDVVYLGCAYSPNAGLYKSCNGGISWKLLTSRTSIYDIEILPNDTSHILIGAHGEILESFDSGNSWNSLLADMKDIHYDIHVIKVSSKNPVMMCAGLWSNYVNKSGFYISTDGSFWERKMNGIYDDIDNVDVRAIAIDPKNDNNIFLGNLSGVYKTTDMGSHWLLSNGIGYVSDIEIAPDNPKMIFAASGALSYNGSGTGLYLSQDGGSSWEKISFDSLSDETRNSINILPESDNYKIFVGTKSNGCFEGEYPRKVKLPTQPIIISPNGKSNIPRRTVFDWHASDLTMFYNLRIAEDSSLSSIVFDTTSTDTTMQLDDSLTANTQYFWQVRAINIYGDTSNSLIANFTTGTIVGIKDKADNKPNIFALYQNYPNPFNPTTTIKYTIPKTSFVTIRVFDVLGNEVAQLLNENKTTGDYKIEFNASHLASGIYFYRMQAGNFVSTKKLLLIK